MPGEKIVIPPNVREVALYQTFRQMDAQANGVVRGLMTGFMDGLVEKKQEIGMDFVTEIGCMADNTRALIVPMPRISFDNASLLFNSDHLLITPYGFRRLRTQLRDLNGVSFSEEDRFQAAVADMRVNPETQASSYTETQDGNKRILQLILGLKEKQEVFTSTVHSDASMNDHASQPIAVVDQPSWVELALQHGVNMIRQKRREEEERRKEEEKKRKQPSS